MDRNILIEALLKQLPLYVALIWEPRGRRKHEDKGKRLPHIWGPQRTIIKYVLDQYAYTTHLYSCNSLYTNFYKIET